MPLDACYNVYIIITAAPYASSYGVRPLICGFILSVVMFVRFSLSLSLSLSRYNTLNILPRLHFLFLPPFLPLSNYDINLVKEGREEGRREG